MSYDDLFPLLPHRGVGFRDIGPFLASSRRYDAYRELAAQLPQDVQVLAALDARGYLVAEGIAPYLDSRPGVVQVRKKGKLPGVTSALKFDYEYASAEFEVVRGSVKSGQQVIIVDDVLATGGSALTARQLVEQEGGIVRGLVCLILLKGLGGEEKFGLPVHTLTSFRGTRTPEEVAAQTQPALIPQTLQEGTLSVRTQDGPILLFPCPSQKAKAQRLQAYAPTVFQAADISWGAFPDGWGNITFPDVDTLGEGSKHLVYLGSFYKPSYVMEQLSMVTAMCGQPARSYTLDFPFLPVTFERVTHEGAGVDKHGMVQFSRQSVATAHTLLKQLCGAVSGRPSLRYFDIHAEAVRFFHDDRQILPRESSMLPFFLRLLDVEYTEQMVMLVFPDEGALKRFMPYVKDSRHTITTCVKKRGAGEQREVSLKDVYVLRASGKRELVATDAFVADNNVQQIFLVDDLVQSGSTLRECAVVLHQKFPRAQCNAFAVHPIFPQEAHLRFAPGGKWANTFQKFYVCDTVPEVAEKLRGVIPFQVLDTTPILVDKYLRQFKLPDHERFYGQHRVYVASQSSPEKFAAAKYAFAAHYPFARVEVKFAPSPPSGQYIDAGEVLEHQGALGPHVPQGKPITNPVNPQPVGFHEALKGALQRLEATSVPSDEHLYSDCWVVSVENAAFQQPYTPGKYHDQAVVVVRNVNTHRTLYTCTHPVELDVECLAQSAAARYQHTAGEYIALKHGVSATNWHASLVGVSRVDLIKEAICQLLYHF